MEGLPQRLADVGRHVELQAPLEGSVEVSLRVLGALHPTVTIVHASEEGAARQPAGGHSVLHEAAISLELVRPKLHLDAGRGRFRRRCGRGGGRWALPRRAAGHVGARRCSQDGPLRHCSLQRPRRLRPRRLRPRRLRLRRLRPRRLRPRRRRPRRLRPRRLRPRRLRRCLPSRRSRRRCLSGRTRCCAMRRRCATCALTTPSYSALLSRATCLPRARRTSAWRRTSIGSLRSWPASPSSSTRYSCPFSSSICCGGRYILVRARAHDAYAYTRTHATRSLSYVHAMHPHMPCHIVHHCTQRPLLSAVTAWRPEHRPFDGRDARHLLPALGLQARLLVL